VYVFIPEHKGSALMTSPATVRGSPHELSTEGGDGMLWASLIQATVEPPLGGKMKVGGLMV
jgi:hypothetical protein